MKLLLVVNKEAWAVGTLARLFKLGAPAGWDVRIVSGKEMHDNPRRFAAWVASSDIVHWMLHRTFADAEAFQKSGRHVVTVHHLDDDEVDIGYLARAHWILVGAKQYQREIERKLGSTGLVRCIPYPVDRAFLDRGAQRRDAGKRAVFRIGFFAAAEYENRRKGIDLLPAVCAGMAARRIPFNVVVTGLGWGRILAKDEYRSLPIQSTIVPSFFDMPRLYDTIDVYLCLSRVEGGPMPVFEALASGVPVVSTTVGKIPDFLERGTLYLDIPFDDPGAAVDRLARLYEEPALGPALCARARPILESRLSVETYQLAMARFYASAMGVAADPVPSCDESRQRALRRAWRAWDRTYWAKELWTAGEKRQALRLLAEAILLDPLCEGIWRIPRRAISRACHAGEERCVPS